MIGTKILLTGLLFFILMIIVARSDKNGTTTKGDGLNIFCGTVLILSYLFMFIGIIGWIWGF